MLGELATVVGWTTANILPVSSRPMKIADFIQTEFQPVGPLSTTEAYPTIIVFITWLTQGKVPAVLGN